MKKILIIEDDKNVLSNLEVLFSLSGYIVLKASSGKEGLELAEQSMPDLIISDVMMSEMDGFEVLKRIKINEKTQNTKFIFLSAIAEPKEINRALSMGASHFINKPFRSKNLLDIINELLNSNRKE